MRNNYAPPVPQLPHAPNFPIACRPARPGHNPINNLASITHITRRLNPLGSSLIGGNILFIMVTIVLLFNKLDVAHMVSPSIATWKPERADGLPPKYSHAAAP